MTDNSKYIEQLENQLKESNRCLKSILYVPEQVNWKFGEDNYKPEWLVNLVEENEKVLSVTDKNLVPQIVLHAAQEIFNACKISGNYPEDDWFAISKHWDLNLWTDDENGSKHASIYPVNDDGDIDPSNGISISDCPHGWSSKEKCIQCETGESQN